MAWETATSPKRESADFDILLIACVAVAAIVAARRLRLIDRLLAGRRRAFIDAYVFPPELLGTLRETWPHLRDWQLPSVQRALRSYFIAHVDAGPRAALAMPSLAADALWHAFILDTRAYHAFCERAFGRYFHHVPAWRMSTRSALVQERAFDRVWARTCAQTGIDPRRPHRLPLLFALDQSLQLPDAQTFDREALARRYAGGGWGGETPFGCGGGGCSSAGGGDSCCGASDSGCSGDGGGSDGGCCGDGGGDGGCGGGCGGD